MSDSITLCDVLAMDQPTWLEWLRGHGACEEALAWAARQPTPRAAWEACDRPDWLLWLCRTLHVGYDDSRRYVRCALAAAQAVESRMLDLTSRDALAFVGRWLRCEVANAEMLEAVGWAAWAMRAAAQTAVAASVAASADAAADAAAARAQTVDAAVAEAWAASSWASSWAAVTAAVVVAAQAAHMTGAPMGGVCDVIRAEWRRESGEE